MLTNLFESRNKTFLNLVKLGDYLGRSLRENLELFTVNDSVVTYLTESGQAIRGSYSNNGLTLNGIKVENASIFEDKDVYSKLVDKKVNNFLADILENDLEKVQESFDSILGLWETRLQFDRTKDRLMSKVEKFTEGKNIIATPEFERVVELKGDLVKMLKESSSLVNIPEIRNTIKLSSVISKSFNIPRITFEELQESGSYSVPSKVNHTLYDHLCKQELIAKELVESKNDLEHVWITNEKVQKLPSYIYESDDNIMALVAEIITDIPYFSMATKKQLTTLVEGNLDLLVDTKTVPAKDIKDFVAKIFEFKKPVKNHVIEILNEKYGVNIQNLTDIPTFDSLVKTHVLIFESLAKLSPKNSVLKKVLYEFSESMTGKSGVESIDVSDFLNMIFEEAEYTNSINETSLLNYLNFEKVADDLGKIGQVLKMIQAGAGGPAADAMGAAMGMAQGVPQGEMEYEPDGGELAGMGDEEEMGQGMEGDGGDDMPAMDAEQAAAEVQGEEAMGEDGMGEDEGGMSMEGEEDAPLDFEGEEGDEEGEFQEKGELVDNLRELEELIAALKDDMDLDTGEGGEGEFEEEDGEEVPEEESEEMPDEMEGSEGGDESEESEGSEEEFEDEEDSEEERPTKKFKDIGNK